jgi:hypothetical protein
VIVILSEAKNLSGTKAKDSERFFASLRMIASAFFPGPVKADLLYRFSVVAKGTTHKAIQALSHTVSARGISLPDAMENRKIGGTSREI